MNDEMIRRIDEYLVGFSLPCMESTDMAMLLKDCRAALLRSSEDKHTRYVPMSDDELGALWENDKNPSIVGALANIEAEVIRRAGLDVSND